MTTFQKVMSRGIALIMALNLMTGMASAATELATPVIISPAQNEVLKNFPRTVHLEWTRVFGATQYNVNLTCVKSAICVVGSTKKPYTAGTGNTYLDVTLTSDDQYSLTVQPQGTDGSVGSYSAIQSFSSDTSTFMQDVNVTGKFDDGLIKLKWDNLAGLGSTFDTYNVRWKKSSALQWLDSNGDGVANSYTTQNYYNIKLDAGAWSFNIAPVKMVDGKYKEVFNKNNAVVVTIPDPETDCEVNPPKITYLAEYGQSFSLNGGNTLTFDLTQTSNITHYWSTCKEATKYELQYSGNNFQNNSYVKVWEGTYNNVGIAGMVLGKQLESIIKNNGGKISIRMRAVTEKGNVDGPALTFNAEVTGETPAEGTYKGANGQTYTENDFKFTDNVWKVYNNNYAKIAWAAPSEKYIDGYAVYAISGPNGFPNALNGQTPVYVSKYTTNYTFPKYFNDNGIVTFKVYPYVQLADGAKKFLQSGYEYFSVSVKVPKISNEEETLAAPSITSPVSNEVLKNFPRTAYLSWTSVANAASYDIQVACDLCGSAAWQSVSSYSTTNNWYTTPGLAGDNQFRVRVRAISASGNVGNWSDYRYFSYRTPAPVNNNDADAINLSIVSWTNGTPLLQWSAYTDKAFNIDGYGMFVRQGTWDKNKVTWVDPSYFDKTQTSHQISKVFTNTTYTVRIVPYMQTATGKQFIYPASNILVFTTGDNNNPVPPSPKTCGNGTGNAAGGDGSYGVCVGDTIDHEDTLVTVKVLKLTNKQVKLQIDGADKNIIVLKNASKGGKSKTLKTDADMLLTIKFVGIGAGGGATIQLTSQDIE